MLSNTQVFIRAHLAAPVCGPPAPAARLPACLLCRGGAHPMAERSKACPMPRFGGGGGGGGVSADTLAEAAFALFKNK